MEKIGHFLDNEVAKLYQECKDLGLNKFEASPYIVKNLNIEKILKNASKNFDGGYAMAGLIGHGDAFVLRDPSGIRPAYYAENDEIVVVTSERPVIQTAFNLAFEEIQELTPGHALIIKKDNSVSVTEINAPIDKKACSFERIYFSRGSDAEIYRERKQLGVNIMPEVLKSIDNDIDQTVFSYIPNTAETSFYGMIEAANDFLNQRKTKAILDLDKNLNQSQIEHILSTKVRTEKIAIKDAKLRTFITEDSSRNDLVAHVYDVTYGVVKPTDNLVIIDDSIVRGTTLKESILKILDRLGPKKIIIVSSAPQIRFPDCYGIDMANLDGLVAFQAAIQLLKDSGNKVLIEEVYQLCLNELQKPVELIQNVVKSIYEPFSYEEVSRKISQLLKPTAIKAEVDILFQTIEGLHQACPKNLGDWYFTGDYPTPGGNRVAVQSFVNFMQGSKERAY
jgi:amidophosphoribosyltransferase